jgi:hypothetical protein
MNKKEQLLKAIEIEEKIGDNFNHTNFIKEVLENKSKLSAYQINSLASELFTKWNESIHPNTEFFWEEVNKAGVEFKRKEPLRFALEKGRFRNVHQAMEARQNWSEVRKLETIRKRFTKAEIEEIDKILLSEEKKRLELLKKCLIKKKIPQSQYLRFGDSMAYFNNCDLFRNYFTPIEVKELYTVWKNFKSK